MKCGTSSIFKYLLQHPSVGAPQFKEIHFFDRIVANRRGEHWYRAHFPKAKDKLTSIDASPRYIFNGKAAARAHKLLPDAKIIVALRDPVSRAFSHYHHALRRGHVKQPFDQFVLPLLQLDPETAKEGKIESMLARGRYAEQIERWFLHYPREQFIFINLPDLVNQTQVVMDELFGFLGLPPHVLTDIEPKNPGGYSDWMDESTESALRNYFAPHNARLESLLGRKMGWERRAK